MYVPTAPSLVLRLAFLAAEAMPFLRSTTIASSTLPFASTSAERQSIIGAPVFSRRSFTCAAETFSVTVDILYTQFSFVEFNSIRGRNRLLLQIHSDTRRAWHETFAATLPEQL